MLAQGSHAYADNHSRGQHSELACNLPDVALTKCYTSKLCVLGQLARLTQLANNPNFLTMPLALLYNLPSP